MFGFELKLLVGVTWWVVGVGGDGSAAVRGGFEKLLVLLFSKKLGSILTTKMNIE